MNKHPPNFAAAMKKGDSVSDDILAINGGGATDGDTGDPGSMHTVE